jgi:hypothetical protein
MRGGSKKRYAAFEQTDGRQPVVAQYLRTDQIAQRSMLNTGATESL